MQAVSCVEIRSDGVGGAFDLLEGHRLGSSARMVVLFGDHGQHLVGDAIAFVRRRFGEGHG